MASRVEDPEYDYEQEEGDEEEEEYEYVDEEEEEEEEDDDSHPYEKTATAKPLQTPTGFRSRLSRFFTFYEPSQLPIVSQWTRNWIGREEELMGHLIRFHGPEPTLSDSIAERGIVPSSQATATARCRELLLQFYFLYAPEKSVEADQTIQAWRGREDELLKKLRRQSRLRDWIMNFFYEQQPNHLPEVPQMLREWFGRETELVKLLRKHHTAEKSPDRTAVQQPRQSPKEDPVPVPFASWRDQLIHFYSIYNPGKASQVDVILDVYKGKEAMLFRKLQQKYGLIPDDEVDKAAHHDKAARGGGGEATPSPQASSALSSTNPMSQSTKKIVKLLCAAWNPSAALEVADVLGASSMACSEVELLQKLVSIGVHSSSSSESSDDSSDDASSDNYEGNQQQASADVACDTEEAEEGETADTDANQTPPAARLATPPAAPVVGGGGGGEAVQQKPSAREAIDILFPSSHVGTQTPPCRVVVHGSVDDVELRLKETEERLEEIERAKAAKRALEIERRRAASRPPGPPVPPPSDLLLQETVARAMMSPSQRREEGHHSHRDPYPTQLNETLPPLMASSLHATTSAVAATPPSGSGGRSGSVIAENAATHDLSVWLHSIGLGHLYTTFVQNEVLLDCVPYLTADDLGAIGVSSTRTQQHILQEASKILSGDR